MRRSREALRSALLALIRERPFEQLSVREIAIRAKVSFPTFYRQFASKEELLDDIAAEEIQTLLAITLPLMESEQSDLSTEAICAFVSERRTLWRILLTTGASATLRDEFITRSKAIGLSHKRLNPELPIDLMMPLIAGGIFEVLAWWLQQPSGPPSSVVAEMLDKLVLWPSRERLEIPYFLETGSLRKTRE